MRSNVTTRSCANADRAWTAAEVVAVLALRARFTRICLAVWTVAVLAVSAAFIVNSPSFWAQLAFAAGIIVLSSALFAWWEMKIRRVALLARLGEGVLRRAEGEPETQSLK